MKESTKRSFENSGNGSYTLKVFCPCCHQQLGNHDKSPVVICPKLHTVCKNCYQKELFKNSQQSKCIQCGNIILKSKALKYKYLEQLKKIFTNIGNDKSFYNQSSNENEKHHNVYQRKDHEQQEKIEWLLMILQRKQTEINKLKHELGKENNSEKVQELSQLEKSELHQQDQPLISRKAGFASEGINFERKVTPGPVEARYWIDSQCVCIDQLITFQNSITAKAASYVFGCSKLVGQSAFTATFKHIGGVCVSVGVVDSSYRSKTSLLGVPNLMYYESDGKFRAESEKVSIGKGFKVGEPVTVVVDQNRGLIEWRVGSEVRQRAKSELLKKQQIDWVPYICLSSANDSVYITW